MGKYNVQYQLSLPGNPKTIFPQQFKNCILFPADPGKRLFLSAFGHITHDDYFLSVNVLSLQQQADA